MATTPTQVRIDAEIKKEATALFAVEVPQYSNKTLSAMAEAGRISRDPDVTGYTSMDELKAALDD